MAVGESAGLLRVRVCEASAAVTVKGVICCALAQRSEDRTVNRGLREDADGQEGGDLSEGGEDDLDGQLGGDVLALHEGDAVALEGNAVLVLEESMRYPQRRRSAGNVPGRI